MTYLWATLLVVLNTAWLFLVVLGLPGNWLMVIGAGLLWWWQRSMFSPWTLVAVAVMAGIGELLEFLAGLVGARRAGGSRRSAAGALVGGILGGVLGMGVPLPVLGPLLGASVGAFVGAMGLDLWAGRTMEQAVQTGTSAGIGRFLGTVLKLAVGVAIWIVLAAAAYWP